MSDPLIRGTAEIEIVDGVAPEYFEAAAKGGSGEGRLPPFLSELVERSS